MPATRYYSIRLYGLGTFPRFLDSFKRMTDVDRWLAMAKSDGYHMAEVLRERANTRGTFGVERDIVKTIHWSH